MNSDDHHFAVVATGIFTEVRTMPSVYTIEGASPRRRKKTSSKQKAAQARFKTAAKRCKGLNQKKFRACMSRALKK